jgi:hypothetical protein
MRVASKRQGLGSRGLNLAGRACVCACGMEGWVGYIML